MTAEPTLHVMCGLVAAGKSTVARRLADEMPALRLSRDEWMLRLQGGEYDDPNYVALLGPCTEMLWQVATDALGLGVDVVLDWNHWSRQQRTDARVRADAAGYAVVVHFVDVPVEEAVRRAVTRDDPRSHHITEAGIRHSASLLERPDESEGMPIRRHGPGL